jgi:hypothetical protein
MHTLRPLRPLCLALLAFSATHADAVEIAAPSAHPLNPVVAGTYTVDGDKSTLRYAYTRQRDDAKDGATIDVLLSNIALDDEHIDRLVGEHYQGMKKLAALLLTFDANDPKHWQTQFVSETNVSGTAGMTSIGGPDPKIVDGRLIGMIALRHQGAAHQHSFMVYFDAPLAPPDDAQKCSAAAASTFARLGGRWGIEQWKGWGNLGGKTEQMTYSGTLNIDERLNPQQYHGTLHIVVGHGIPDISEQVTLTCRGGKVSLRGAVIPETPWDPDVLELDMRDDRLSGAGTDSGGHEQSIALKKIR